MGETYEGNGVDFTFSGLTLEPKTIEIPGWSKEELKISTLQNASVHTKFVAALKDYGKLFIVTPFDAAVISVPSVGSITFYAEISELDAITQANDEVPEYRIGFSITNLNAGVETAPAFTT
jgi:hypothetical protein